jgi:hypothetical protein
MRCFLVRKRRKMSHEMKSCAMLGMPSPYPHPPIGGAHERESVRMTDVVVVVVV